MERADLDRYYAENTGLIHMVAKKGYARLMSIGASYDYLDLFQELSLVFVKAYDAFDDNNGNKFSTYFAVSAYHKVNAIAEDIQTERIDLKMRSVEEMASWSEDGKDESELIADDSATPEQQHIANVQLANLMARLSPLAAQIVTLAIDPPEFIEREFAANSAHAKLSREKGTEIRASRSLNVAFVCSVLDKARIVRPLPLREARLEIARVAQGVFSE